MSASDEAASDVNSEADFVRREWASTLPYDPELARLVNFINALDRAEIGVTLHLKGCVVSGMLISMTQFYRLFMKDFGDPSRMSETSDLNAAKVFADFFQTTLDNAEQTLQEYRDNEDFVYPSPRHIHMRYTQTLIGDSGRPFTQNLWRGRLAEVDGWSTGNFGPIPPLPPEDA